MTKKNARKGRSDGKKNFLDQLINCGRVEGRLNLKNARFSHDNRTLDEGCTCPACSGGFTRAYINHLVRQHEMTGAILLSLHNIHYLLDLMRRAREAIMAGTYGSFVRDWENSPAVNDF